jgi:hypothetical protein
MKRYSTEHVQQVVVGFANSSLADAWDMFGPDIRRIAIDSLVVDAMRAADVADSAIQLTAGEIMRFRALIEAALADGVKRHRSAMRRRFVVSDYQQGHDDGAASVRGVS